MLAIFQSFGLPELGIILLIALIIFGPSRLPQIGKSVGKALREFREGSSEVTKSIQEGIDGSEEEKPKKEKKADKAEKEKKAEQEAEE